MWILNFLPFWFFHLITLVGIVGLLAASFVVSMIPLFDKYKLPIQAICLFLLVFGIYMEGAISNEEKWQSLVKEMEAKVALAEEKSKTANAKIVFKFLDKVKFVDKTQVVIQEKLKEVEKVIDARCEIDPSVISILNEAAKAPK
jgi:hypothetical protein